MHRPSSLRRASTARARTHVRPHPALRAGLPRPLSIAAARFVAVVLAASALGFQGHAEAGVAPALSARRPADLAELRRRLWRAWRIAEAFARAGAIDVCDVRLDPHPTVSHLALGLGLPLWSVRRVNPGRQLDRIHWRASLRVPVLTRRAARACFTPIRPFRHRGNAGPPFYW